MDGAGGPAADPVRAAAGRGQLELRRQAHRAAAERQELPAAVGELPPAGPEAGQDHRRRGDRHPPAPCHARQQVVGDRAVPAGEDGQRDQELLADALQEGAAVQAGQGAAAAPVPAPAAAAAPPVPPRPAPPPAAAAGDADAAAGEPAAAAGDDDAAAEPAGGGPGRDHHHRQHEQHGDCWVLLPVPGGVGGARPPAPGRRRGRALGQPLAARRRGGRLQRRRLRRVLATSSYCVCYCYYHHYGNVHVSRCKERKKERKKERRRGIQDSIYCLQVNFSTTTGRRDIIPVVIARKDHACMHDHACQ